MSSLNRVTHPSFTIASGTVIGEVLNISAPPKSGVILVLADGNVVEYTKVGGRTIKYPQLSPHDEMGVADLVQRVRGLLEKG